MHTLLHWHLLPGRQFLWLRRQFNGGYRQNGINMPTAAEAIGTPSYLLSAWLRKQNLTYASWMNSLRISEAKRLLRA